MTSTYSKRADTTKDVRKNATFPEIRSCGFGRPNTRPSGDPPAVSAWRCRGVEPAVPALNPTPPSLLGQAHSVLSNTHSFKPHATWEAMSSIMLLIPTISRQESRCSRAERGSGGRGRAVAQTCSSWLLQAQPGHGSRPCPPHAGRRLVRSPHSSFSHSRSAPPPTPRDTGQAAGAQALSSLSNLLSS